MNKLSASLCAALLACPMAAWALQQDPAAPPPIAPGEHKEAAPNVDPAAPPPLPPKVQDEQVEPTVEIHRDEKDNIVEEYRLNGRLYMVKITPKNGLPYYYLDTDGDGQLELRESDRAANPVQPVYWKIKEW